MKITMLRRSTNPQVITILCTNLFTCLVKIPAAKANVNKKWDKLKNLPAWRDLIVKSKQEVIEQAQKEGTTVHFAALMDL